jgi:hypothetical protein
MATSGVRVLGTAIMLSWHLTGVFTGCGAKSLCIILRRFRDHP